MFVSAPAARPFGGSNFGFRLQLPGILRMLRAPMSNRAIWSMRKRHEWLATPLKKKRIKKATRLRCGLQDAMDRKAGTAEAK
jgi:hypothetical protein